MDPLVAKNVLLITCCGILTSRDFFGGARKEEENHMFDHFLNIDT